MSVAFKKKSFNQRMRELINIGETIRLPKYLISEDGRIYFLKVYDDVPAGVLIVYSSIYHDDIYANGKDKYAVAKKLALKVNREMDRGSVQRIDASDYWAEQCQEWGVKLSFRNSSQRARG